MAKREWKPILSEKEIHLYRFMKKALGAEKNAVDDRVAKSEKPQKSSGTSHAKVVRDGFSMPSVDYNFIAEIQFSHITFQCLRGLYKTHQFRLVQDQTVANF